MFSYNNECNEKNKDTKEGDVKESGPEVRLFLTFFF